MAPEIIEGKPYNEMADVYSYSMCIFHVITRTPPWVGTTDSQWERLEEKALSENPVERITFKPDVPSYFTPSLTKLMEDCWNYSPVLRPTFDSVIERISLLETEPSPEGMPS